MTGNEIIIEALLLHGVIYPGQTISAEAQATSEKGFNLMLGEWNATGHAVYAVVRTGPHTLVSGTADYTIGTGGTFAIARPEKIEAWAVSSSSGAASNGVPVDPATFAAIAKDRSATGSLIDALNYESSYPLGTLHLYPKPNGGTLELWVWQQFAEITDFTAAVAFPPGYLKAIIYNLAIDLAPKFGRPLDPTVKLKADECKAALGSVNAGAHTKGPAAA